MDTRSPSPHLAPPGDARQRLVAAYYERLLQHPPFARDLRDVFTVFNNELLPFLSLGDGAPAIDDWGFAAHSAADLFGWSKANRRAAAEETDFAKTCADWAQAWRELPEGLALFGEQAARGWLSLGRAHLAKALWCLRERQRALRLLAERALARYLAKRWPLPASAYEDIPTSFTFWRAGGQSDAALLFLPLLQAAGLVPKLLTPQRLPAFPQWHPGREAWAAVSERVETFLANLRRQLLDQAAAAEREAQALGWQRPPARPPDLSRRAEQLFQRLVLKRSWAAVTRAVGATDRAAVRRQVIADAQLLGLPLP